MKKAVGLLLSLAILMTGACFLYGYLMKSYAPVIDSPATSMAPATDFTFTDENGKEVNLSDFYGKPIVLNFWASWCSPCKNEMPVFDEAYKKYGEDVSFIMLNVTDGKRETVDSAKDFLKSVDYQFPVFFDSEKEGGKAYTLTGVPMTMIIDAQGNIVKTFRGEVSENAIEKVLEGLVK